MFYRQYYTLSQFCWCSREWVDWSWSVARSLSNQRVVAMPVRCRECSPTYVETLSGTPNTKCSYPHLWTPTIDVLPTRDSVWADEWSLHFIGQSHDWMLIFPPMNVKTRRNSNEILQKGDRSLADTHDPRTAWTIWVVLGFENLSPDITHFPCAWKPWCNTHNQQHAVQSITTKRKPIKPIDS